MKQSTFTWPKPIRTIKDSKKIFNKALYRERILEDPRMGDTASLIALGDIIFKNAKPQNIIRPIGTPIDFKKDFWNFYAINGLESMKRGFFQIVNEPKTRDILGIQTWSASVLFNAGNNLDEHFLYYANVGPIVNSCAVAGNLTTRKFLRLPGRDYKERFLTTLINKPFYVSRAEFVDSKKYKNMKEVLWFKWD